MNFNLKNVIFFLFFISGISAIVYQVVWQRYLTFSFGSDTLSTTIIVSVFMLGLGLGSYLGGKISDSLYDMKRLKLYIVIEIVIAVFGVFSNYFLYEVLYQRLSTESLTVAMLTSFLFLLPPTTAMGSTLPLLSKLFETSLKEVKINTYYLYAVNTFGASFGAFIPFFIIAPRLGFDALIYFAASLNAICALVTIAVYYFYRNYNPESAPKTYNEEEVIPESSHAELNWYLLFGISGFIALSLEMIWFRTLHIMLKGNSFTFAILLSIYIGGIAIGSVIGLLYLRRIKNPTQLFFRLQSWIVIYTLFSYILLYFGLKNMDFLELINRYLYSYEKDSSYRMFLLTASLSTFFVIPPTLLMGISFVSLQEASNKSVAYFGKKLGTLLFFNIVFSSVSVIITTFILFEYLGTSLTLLFLAFLLIVLIVYKLIYIDKINRYKVESSVLIATTIVIILIFPDNQSLWKVFQGSHGKEIMIMEDKSSVSTIKLNFDNSNSDIVFLNGLGQSYFPYHDDVGHLQLGYIPVILHPNPKKIAIVGFGSGGTLYAASQSEKTKQIDCFEISSNQYDIVKKYAAMRGDETVKSLFNDSRIKMHIEDGRKALLNSPEKYDIIEADALRPNSSYSGNIYSIEYFELIKSKLNAGGFAVSWAPTDRITNGFARVFPYTYTDGFIIIGSASEIQLNLNAEINEEFKALPVDWNKSISGLKRIKYIPDHEVNHDLFPKDEFQ